MSGDTILNIPGIINIKSPIEYALITYIILLFKNEWA